MKSINEQLTQIQAEKETLNAYLVEQRDTSKKLNQDIVRLTNEINSLVSEIKII